MVSPWNVSGIVAGNHKDEPLNSMDVMTLPGIDYGTDETERSIEGCLGTTSSGFGTS